MNWLARLKKQDSLETDPTKPTEPGFVGSVGSILGNIEFLGVGCGPLTADLLRTAMAVCDRHGDGEAAREEMRADCRALPPHLQADLLAHFGKNQECPETDPTKPTKPGSVGFVGANPEHFQKLGTPPQTIAKFRAASMALAEPPANWRSLHAKYMVHHWHCRACMTAGQGNGQRCPAGLALWLAYEREVGSRGAAWLSEAFEERAAIMEFDGGMRRSEAETTAQSSRGVAT